ncbi:MAG: hypothetical protein IPL23_25315 [Saprospiraceae bacterium]|nr:hypothetical protein [Saprospiraceae bacterium]
MRTKFNQLFYTFIFIMFLSTSARAGLIPPPGARVGHSPTNPVAGQTVTFTVPEADVSSCETVSIAPDLENNPGVLLSLTLAAGVYTTTYVYPSPGTYQVGYDVNLEGCITNRNQPKNSRALEPFYLDLWMVDLYYQPQTMAPLFPHLWSLVHLYSSQLWANGASSFSACLAPFLEWS